MSRASTLLHPSTTATEAEETCHLFCCDMDLSTCGTDISDEAVVYDPPRGAVCVVCDDLDWQPCPRCGA